MSNNVPIDLYHASNTSSMGFFAFRGYTRISDVVIATASG